MKPTQEELKRLFRYDPVAGQLTKDGVQVGWIDHKYRRVSVNSRKYYAHRVIWCMVYGYWPENDIDHINQNCSDNRLDNLREVSRSCNLQNTSSSGVSYDTRRAKWRAQITVNYKNHTLGRFDCFDEAIAHRRAAEECLGFGGVSC